jgi:hypothetical protein
MASITPVKIPSEKRSVEDYAGKPFSGRNLTNTSDVIAYA